MADMNINGVNNLQNTNLTKTEKAEQQPEEISGRVASGH